ncbi:hypothetical protein [Marinomonas transparens]|uniref:Uncharacterized protein n=1 Tax=Marinomonas transparens TaxID=2795388 RepID=A0A934JN42_9GAMM|nr:hypothetical protein [Marinomonas transparens]MBJ7539280.1 hypothetical protein [Marinomonas transparens]
MSISSISNTTSWYNMLPSSSMATGTSSDSDLEKRGDPVQLSTQAHQLQKAQQESNSESKKANEEDSGKEFVQVSSSIGRTSRITGLNRDDVAALYRSIDQLS